MLLSHASPEKVTGLAPGSAEDSIAKHKFIAVKIIASFKNVQNSVIEQFRWWDLQWDKLPSKSIGSEAEIESTQFSIAFTGSIDTPLGLS